MLIEKLVKENMNEHLAFLRKNKWIFLSLFFLPLLPLVDEHLSFVIIFYFFLTFYISLKFPQRGLSVIVFSMLLYNQVFFSG